jgi:hypothetical protein
MKKNSKLYMKETKKGRKIENSIQRKLKKEEK